MTTRRFSRRSFAMIGSFRKKFWRVPLTALCQLLVLQPVWGQQAAEPRDVRIVVIQGEGARNVVQQIPPRQIVIRVDDQNNRPVAGATVVFTAPQVGPSGDFEDESRTIRVITGSDGLATAGAFHPNAIPGRYQVLVNAEFQGRSALSLITQTNIAEGRGRGKVIATLAIVGAAAAAVVVFRSKDNSSGTTNGPTITFGGSAVGAPR
jgi:hypothetical protein